MKKKVILVALMMALAVLAVGCGEANVSSGETSQASTSASSATTSVSSSSISAAKAPSLELAEDIQEGNTVIQIPKFVAEGNNPAVDTLNEEIQKNQGEVYKEWKDAQDPVRGLEIKSYLFTSEDYVQAVVTQLEFPTYGTHGDVFSYHYDVKEQKVVTLADALAKFNLTEDDVLAQFQAAYRPESSVGTMDKAEIQGFRILEDSLECYVKVYFVNSNQSGEEGKYNQIVVFNMKDGTASDYNGETLIDPMETDAGSSSSQVSSAASVVDSKE